MSVVVRNLVVCNILLLVLNYVLVYLNLIYLDDIRLLRLSRAISWHIIVRARLYLVELRGKLLHCWLENIRRSAHDKGMAIQWIKSIYLILNNQLLLRSFSIISKCLLLEQLVSRLLDSERSTSFLLLNLLFNVNEAALLLFGGA